MAKKNQTKNLAIPATVEGMDKPLVPVVEQPVQPPDEGTPPPLGGTIAQLLEYADQRYSLVQGLWRRTIHQYLLMGSAFREVQDRLDAANKGKSKRDPGWLSFEELVKATGVSPNTARRAADVARAFRDPAELEGLTIKDAVEIARSLAAVPETASEKMERLKKQREKAADVVQVVDRRL